MTVPEIQGVEIEGQIGQGGVATVWKGRQLTLDRPVAVKVLQAQWEDDPADVERFQAEARAAAKLKHASIIQVHDANFIEGKYYIVMEFIDGYTVGDWLRRKGKLSQKDALLIAECVADGLSYAWQKERIIHCDIKPDNVMVDRDGTVKIADLGLARTIDVLRPSSETNDEVMGTPAYMSPEQVSGLSDLDCRADIYSLGCMLYHILTGKMPFEGNDVDRVLAQQAQDQIPDILDVVGGVSKPMCALLQKMMAKDRALRQADWQEVLADIQSVRHGCLPGGLPPPDASTMACSERRMGAVVDTHVETSGKSWCALRKFPLLALVMITVGFGVAGLLGVVFWPDTKPAAPGVVVPDEQEAAAAVVDDGGARAVREAEARHHYERALAWLQHTPLDFDGAMRALRGVDTTYPDTEYAALARREMARIGSLKRAEVDRAMASLRQQVAEHVDGGDFTGAVAVVEGYDGMWATETAALRADLLLALRQQKDERAVAQQAQEAARQQRVRAAWEDLARELLDDGCGSAEQRITRMLESNMFDDEERITLHAMQEILVEASRLHRRVLDSFYRQRSQEVSVALHSGTQQLTILDVDVAGESVIAEQPFMVRGHRAARSMRFSIRDLAPAEYARRAGGEDDLALVLARILETWPSCDLHDLERSLSGFPSPLPEVLLAEVGQRREAILLEELRSTQAVSERQGMGGAQDVSPRRQAQDLSPRQARARARRALVEDADEHWELNEPIRRAMVGANPGLFAEEVRIMREPGSGKALRVEVFSSVLSDIAPLATMSDLEELVCAGVNPRYIWRNSPIAPLQDLSPLRDLPLTILCINNTAVRDLSPLSGMPLLEINASHTQVNDISVLRHAPLEVVLLRGTPVRDISVLRGKPLRQVDLSNTAVFDFRPIAGGMLTHFEAAGSQFRDLSVLHGAPIQHLNISGCGVFRFTPLQDFPLEHLELDKTQIRDLTVLRGKSLRHLSLRETSVSDLSVLAGMPLTSLFLNKTPVSDFSVLASLPLENLDLSYTRIVDLAPLAQLPLRTLSLAGTRVRDLSPLSGLALRTLNISNVPVESLVSLAGMPIERLIVDNPEREHVRQLLLRLPHLHFVNNEVFLR